MSSPEQYQQQKARVARWMAIWLVVYLLQFLGFAVCVGGMFWGGPDKAESWMLAFFAILLARKIFDYVFPKLAESLDPEIAGDLPQPSLYGVILVVALGLLLIAMISW